MPVIVTLGYGPGISRQYSFVNPVDFLTQVQLRAGMPQTGLWDDNFVDRVVSQLEGSGRHPAEAALLRAQKADQTPVTPADAAAAAWVLYDDRVSGGGSATVPPGITPGTYPSTITVTGWTNFRYGTLAPAPPENTTGGGSSTPGEFTADPTDGRELSTAPKARFLDTTTGKAAAFGAGLLVAFILRRV